MMQSSTKALRVLLLVAMASCPCLAQNSMDRVRDTNANTWWVYAGDHQVKGPWSIYSEVQVRRSNFLNIWQQFQTRDAVAYRFSPRAQVAIGYVFTYTGRYGDFPVAHPFNEHRTYQQISLRHELKRAGFEHRYRTEQRWIQNYTDTNNYFWRYQNRFRYQLKATLPITTANAEGRQWYLFAGDELFLPYGPNHGTNSFDQNRAFGGVGYRFTRNNVLEVGYQNQFIIQRNNRIEENDHTLRVMWTSTAALSKLFR